jgi:hypothetical protein
MMSLDRKTLKTINTKNVPFMKEITPSERCHDAQQIDNQNSDIQHSSSQDNDTQNEWLAYI